MISYNSNFFKKKELLGIERCSKGQFSKYGISRKGYAVFRVCVHKCSACR